MVKATGDIMRNSSKEEDWVKPEPSLDTDSCRICHKEDLSRGELMSPCLCSGSFKLVHEKCLNRWISVSKKTSCEMCGYSFHLKKHFRWEWLSLQCWERKKLFWALVATLVTLGWVFWPLTVVMESGAEEVQLRFWNKIVAGTIGFVSAMGFLFLWGKPFFEPIKKLIEYNSSLVIDTSFSPPEEKALPEVELSKVMTNANVEAVHEGRLKSPPDFDGIDPATVTILHVDIGNVGCGFMDKGNR